MKDFLIFHGYSSNSELLVLANELKKLYFVDIVNESTLIKFPYRAHYKCIILCWHDKLINYQFIIKKIKSIKYDSLVLYDDTDDKNCMGCFCEPTFVLKRELYADSSVNFNVPYYCFPKFANDNFVDKQKDIDVCCIMSITSDIRQRLITYLNTIKKANWFIQQTEYENKLPKEQYFDILNRSKIGISIYGGGFDTIRFWEILSCKSALLSPYIPFLTVKIPDHCITYYNENFVDLKEKIDSLLQNDLWKTIAENGYNYFIKNHTVSVRMNFLLNKLKERKIIL